MREVGLFGKLLQYQSGQADSLPAEFKNPCERASELFKPLQSGMSAAIQLIASAGLM
jgi:hypothetical protein